MEMDSRKTSRSGRKVVIWDVYTRLFHWLTVALVASAYITWRLNWMEWHTIGGEALLVLLLFRLGWGFVGSETARFAQFLGPPRTAARHLGRLFHREPDEHIGHNPAGGWMVLVLLLLLFGETITGIVVNNDVADQGPLTEIMPAKIANLITDLHARLWDALLAGMALHVAAIAIYAVFKGHRLLRPMLTGRKYLSERHAAPRLAPVTLAAVVLVCSIVVMVLLANFI